MSLWPSGALNSAMFDYQDVEAFMQQEITIMFAINGFQSSSLCDYGFNAPPKWSISVEYGCFLIWHDERTIPHQLLWVRKMDPAREHELGRHSWSLGSCRWGSDDAAVASSDSHLRKPKRQ